MNKIIAIYIFLIGSTLFASNLDTLSISNNDWIKIDSIKITGNETTEDFIILRELTFGIGDSVNNEILRFNKERIYSLGIFNFVKIFPYTDNGYTKLEIAIEESWYIYPIPFMWIRKSSFKTALYGMNFLYKNFRGRNETLAAIVSFGYDPIYSITYINPAISSDKSYNLRLSLNFQKSNNRSDRAERILNDDFNYDIFRSEVRVGRRLNNYNTFYFASGFNYISTPEFHPEINASIDRKDNVLHSSIAYELDTRDLIQFPKKGLYTSAIFTHKGFGLDNVNYNVFHFLFREYRQFIGSLITKWRLDYRHTFGRSVPIYDYSYLGFENYVRGHLNDEREGNNLILSSLEMSYPLVEDYNFSIKLPLLPQKLSSFRIGLYLTAFGDTGITYNNNEKIDIKKFDTGYGFGLTVLFLPYNAIRFEYSFNEYKKGEFLFGSGFSF